MAEDVEIIIGHPSNPRIAARLCNFVKNSTALLQSHNLWLEANVAPIIRSQQNSWVDLYGYASKLGNAQSNEILSANRCQSVQTKVSTFANQVNFNIGTAKGESESLGDDYDTDPVVAGYWRRVEIFVFASQPPPIIRIPAPVPVFEVRRITHRSFLKFKVNNIRDDVDPGKDTNDLIKDIVEGLINPESALGDENLSARRITSIPSSFRVNRVIFDVKVDHKFLTSETFGLDIATGTMTTTVTSMDYQWGQPLPNVEILNRYQPTVFGEVHPVQIDFKFLPRTEAEKIPLVIPPKVP